MTTKAQKRAQARFDKTRDKAISSRYSEEELAALDTSRRAGESRAAAQKRLALLGNTEMHKWANLKIN